MALPRGARRRPAGSASRRRPPPHDLPVETACPCAWGLRHPLRRRLTRPVRDGRIRRPPSRTPYSTERFPTPTRRRLLAQRLRVRFQDWESARVGLRWIPFLPTRGRIAQRWNGRPSSLVERKGRVQGCSTSGRTMAGRPCRARQPRHHLPYGRVPDLTRPAHAQRRVEPPLTSLGPVRHESRICRTPPTRGGSPAPSLRQSSATCPNPMRHSWAGSRASTTRAAHPDRATGSPSTPKRVRKIPVRSTLRGWFDISPGPLAATSG